MSEQTPHIEPTLNASGSLSAAYFDKLYAARSDPWEFATSDYEAKKYVATLDALPRPRYARALELGCSIGVLTRQLAERCDNLLSIDVSLAALAQARTRCAGLEHVRFELHDLADSFPEGRFDLILLSEVGYYFSIPDLEQLRARVAEALPPQGHLLLVHYTGETNYPLTGNEVHDCFRAKFDEWKVLRELRAPRYRLDLLEKGNDF